MRRCPGNRLLFAFAAYNAGPGRVRQLRNEQGEHLQRRDLKKQGQDQTP